jgi:hypothetical protein
LCRLIYLLACPLGCIVLLRFPSSRTPLARYLHHPCQRQLLRAMAAHKAPRRDLL